MKSLAKLFTIVVFFTSGCSSMKGSSDSKQAHSDSAYHARAIFNENIIKVLNDVIYSIKPSMGKMQYTSIETKDAEIGKEQLSLTMDIAVPPNATIEHRQPLIILIHGGGFITGSKHDQTDAMMSYAKGGFVSATINYRLTRDRGKRGSEQNIAGVVKAMEDVKNAIRFLKANDKLYFIDTNRIATIGFSAGGGLSLANGIDSENLSGMISDFPDINTRVQAAISTGAAAAGRTGQSSEYRGNSLKFDKSDVPIQVFHAKPKDGGDSGKLWDDTVVPLQKLVESSGNSIEVVPQPNLTHTVDLSLDGPYWNYLKPFLWKHLNLGMETKLK